MIRTGRVAFMAAVFVVASMLGCGEGSVESPVGPGPIDGPQPVDGIVPKGLVEITIGGIGGGSTGPTASAASLSPVPEGGGTIQLEPVSTGSFTDGARGAGGQRYVYATYRVRNADAAGTAFDTPRANLAFLAVGTSGTVAGTPISQLHRFDGSQASAAIAAAVVPTGAVEQDADLEVRARYPDVLQVYEVAEVAGIEHPGVVTNFPYGFVVRNPSTPGSRTLPAHPAPDQWDGVVTFAFRVPLQADATDDPFRISAVFLAVDDATTRITQSPEEHDARAWSALQARATALGASLTTVLAGSPVLEGGAVRRICQVRTAGGADAPLGHLHDVAGPLHALAFLRPGESADPCGPHWKAGAPSELGLGVAYTIGVRAMDRYGNVLPLTDDVVLGTTDASASIPGGVALEAGEAQFEVAFGEYGDWPITAAAEHRTTAETVVVTGIRRHWLGGVSSAWDEGANWDHGVVPAPRDTVMIASGADAMPALGAHQTVGGVQVGDGASLEIGSYNLTVTGDVSTATSGAITGLSGYVDLQGFGRSVRGALPRVRVTGTYDLNGNLTTAGQPRVDGGRLRNSGFRYRVDNP